MSTMLINSVCGKSAHIIKESEYDDVYDGIVCCSECQTIMESRNAWVKCGDCLRPECKGCR